MPLSIAVRETKGACSPMPIRIAKLNSSERHGALEVEVSGVAAATHAMARVRSLEDIFDVVVLFFTIARSE